MLQALAPFLIPAGVGAVTSGLQAASQGKNPLEIATSSLIGGGLGAGLGIGGRMAGAALAGTPLAAKLAPSIYKAGGSLPTWLTGMKSVALNPAVQTRLGQSAISSATAGTLGTLGSLAVAPIATGLAGAPGAALRAAGGGAANAAGGASALAGAAGVPGFGANPTPGVYPFEQSPLPAGHNSTWGYGNPYGTMADITNPLSQFNAMRLAEAKEFDTQLRNAQAQAAMMAPWTEGRSKAELARQLYANQVRTNLQTQQSALLGGLQAARQMGVNAASQVGDALTRQYQYS